MGRERGENQRDIQEGMKRYGKTGTEMRGDRDMERQVWGCGRNAGIDRDMGMGDRQADKERHREMGR